MKKALLVSSACLLFAASGLKPASTSVSAATPLQLVQVTGNNKKAAPVTRPTLEILSLGGSPKQELKFQPKVNTKQKTTMTVKMGMTMFMNDQPLPKFNTPTTVTGMETTVTKVDPNGDIHYQFTYTNMDIVADATVPKQIVDAMRSQISQLKNFKGTGIIDSRGVSKKVNFVTPSADPNTKQLLEQLVSSMEQMSSPFPEKPIGIGGQWRVVNKVEMSGIAIKQTAIYELASLKDGVATLNINVEQQAPTAQTFKQPNLPPGVTMTLKSMSGKGQGQVIIPLNSVMPASSKMTVNTNSKMEIKQASNNNVTAMDTKMLIEMTMKSQ